VPLRAASATARATRSRLDTLGTRRLPSTRNRADKGGGVVVEISRARISLSRGFDAELLTDVVRALGAVR
jgi:hypothetical protein